jgi:hypothetical protein
MRVKISVAQLRPSGEAPRMRVSPSVAPRWRAARMAGWSVRAQPWATASTTIGRLKTPKAEATRWPLTFGPRQAPRLVK